MLRHQGRKLAAGTLLGLGAVGTACWLEAQEPARPPGQVRTEEKATMHTGRVERFLKNDHGDVDGLQFADGFDVHFPPHIGRQVVELIATGTEATVWGQKETLPRGEVVFEATRIESKNETIQVDRPAPPPHGPKGPRGPKGPGHRGPRADERPMDAKGTVAEFTTNHHGDVDGLILADGTEVKFPPHLGDELQRIVKAGDQVQIDGRRHVAPHGDVHLHADRITAGNGKVWTRDEIADCRPEPPEPPAAARNREPQPSNAEVMRELGEIRRMLRDLKR